MKIVLVDSKRNLKSGWQLQLQVELLYEDGEVVANQARHVEVYGHDDARPIILPTSGSIDLKVRVLSCSNQHENKSMFLRFSGHPIDKSIPSYATIMPATSTIMTVIRHRLRITEQPPSIWYKDEGGRDRCMAITGLMVDEHEQPVQGREVPLKVLLCYEGDDCTEVKNQQILQMPTDSLPKVDKFGKFVIKVRISEVSKNHQKQSFVVKLMPDTAFAQENHDISADTTTPITVLSKRNKRRPKHGMMDDDSPDGPTPVHAGGYAMLPTMYLPSAAAATATMPAAFTTKPLLSTLAPSHANTALAHASSSTLPTITPTGAAAKPLGAPSAAAGGVASSNLANTSLTGANMTRLTSTEGASMLGDSSQYTAQPQAGFSDTISHLINWCTHAQDLLVKIEWQHVGFEVQEDGQMNLHRPLYRCPAWSDGERTDRRVATVDLPGDTHHAAAGLDAGADVAD